MRATPGCTARASGAHGMFSNPIMLAGLGGAAVPLALHLLSRARYQRVDWGAMIFLQQDASNELRSARVKRWTLLGLRMAAVALLAVALAGPVVESRARPDPATSRTVAAIVIDCSASMSYDEGGRSRMDLARGAVLQILSRLGRSDQAVLVPTPGAGGAGGAGGAAGAAGAAGAGGAALRPSSDLEAVATRVADLEAGDGVANVPEA